MKPALLAAALAGLLLMLTPFVLEHLAPSPATGNDVLPVEQAFVLSHRRDGDELHVSIDIAPGAYLYRHKLAAEGQDVTLGDWSPPAGEPHQDEYFGHSEIYREQLTLTLPLRQAADGGQVMLHYQGCTTGLCYPPQRQALTMP
ncbi:protein-disulfide reductase DsbD domain-containing protein [Oceanimonas marisflavi]|uniref:protein-disulfide reductase DsbD domain-containing protein n=1 Tax=Oceanimonas marisflavi TaxID=2059724 RepID=UPI000D2FAD1C|nr:protein-disulfide reductase DsbD domain-containing protein [Oceanimonas marisflavi]